MNILASRRSRSFLAIALLSVLLIFLGFILLDRYRTENQRLTVEIHQLLGASSVAQHIGNISAGRDPRYFPLLHRMALLNYLASNPSTLTPEQEVEGVPFQVYIDRYEAIWALTHQPQARKARTVQQFGSGANQLFALNPEFESMNSLSIPFSGNALLLEERVEWAARSLECIEGYTGGSFLIDETTRIGLISDWINKCRFSLLKLESVDHLRRLLVALDGIEPPVVAFRSAMKMEYVATMGVLQTSRNATQGGSMPLYREPELHYVLSHLKTRILDLAEPVEPLDSPWYGTLNEVIGSYRGSGIYTYYDGWYDDEFINHTLALSHELADGIKFFREALRYRIARLELGDLAILREDLTVDSLNSGQIRVTWVGKRVTTPTLPELFDPYLFPE